MLHDNINTYILSKRNLIAYNLSQYIYHDMLGLCQTRGGKKNKNNSIVLYLIFDSSLVFWTMNNSRSVNVKNMSNRYGYHVEDDLFFDVIDSSFFAHLWFKSILFFCNKNGIFQLILSLRGKNQLFSLLAAQIAE